MAATPDERFDEKAQTKGAPDKHPLEGGSGQAFDGVCLQVRQYQIDEKHPGAFFYGVALVPDPELVAHHWPAIELKPIPNDAAWYWAMFAIMRRIPLAIVPWGVKEDGSNFRELADKMLAEIELEIPSESAEILEGIYDRAKGRYTRVTRHEKPKNC